MKLLIAGSRTLFDLELVDGLIRLYDLKPTRVICGGANGIDLCGQIWALQNRLPHSIYAAEWSTRGKGAGHARNKEMGEAADHMLLIWDGKSSGSRNMRDWAIKNGLMFNEYITQDRCTMKPFEQRRLLVQLLREVNVKLNIQ